MEGLEGIEAGEEEVGRMLLRSIASSFVLAVNYNISYYRESL